MKKILIPDAKSLKTKRTSQSRLSSRKKNQEERTPEKKAAAARPVDRTHINARLTFTPEEKARVIPLILENLEAGKSLWTSVREVEGAPSATHFQRWVSEDNQLMLAYASSRLKGYLMFAEDIQEIADNPKEGITRTVKTTAEGVETTETAADMLGHRNLQIQTRKWLLSKMVPKIFGEKAAQAVGDPEALNETLRELAAKLPV